MDPELYSAPVVSNSNTYQSVFETSYALLDNCVFNTFSHPFFFGGDGKVEINNVTAVNKSADISYPHGLKKGVNRFTANGTGGVDNSGSVNQGNTFFNGVQESTDSIFAKEISFYNEGSSIPKSKIRFKSAIHPLGYNYTPQAADVEIRTDANGGDTVAARYLGAGVWEPIWKNFGSGSGGSGTNYWTASGSDITKNNSGGVGINTTPASAALHVKSTSSYPYNIKLTDRGAEQTWAFGVDKDVVGDGTFGLYDITNSTAPFSVTAGTGNITAASLAGTGTRMVVANSNGQLSTQAIPSGSGSGTVTSFGFTNGGGFTGSVSNSTTTPTLSLTLQNASTSQAGQLTAADWNTFNSKVSSPWVLSGSDLYYTAGGVGIGTAPSAAALHLKESTSYPYGFKITNSTAGQTWGHAVDIDVTGDGKYGIINVTTGTIPFVISGDNVGIGTTAPNTKLHVAGTIRSDVLAGTGNQLTAANSSGSIINTTIDPAKVLLHTDTVRGGLITTQFYVDSLTQKRVVNVTSLTDAGTYTIPVGTDIVFINIPTGLDAQTIVLPASSINGKEVQIYFGGTIAAGSSVFTNLTISAPSGETLYQVTAPTTATGGDCLHYTLNGVNKKWHRKKL